MRRALVALVLCVSAPFVMFAVALVAAGVTALLIAKKVAEVDVSDDLYMTRLYWDGHRGVAKHDGLRLDLQSCPFGSQVAEVDYAPAVRVYRIRNSAQGWRDMDKAEIARCQSWLELLVKTVWLAQF